MWCDRDREKTNRAWREGKYLRLLRTFLMEISLKCRRTLPEALSLLRICLLPGKLFSRKTVGGRPRCWLDSGVCGRHSVQDREDRTRASYLPLSDVRWIKTRTKKYTSMLPFGEGSRYNFLMAVLEVLEVLRIERRHLQSAV